MFDNERQIASSYGLQKFSRGHLTFWKIGMFDESLDTQPSQTGATHYKAHGSEREQCMFDDERKIAYSYGLQILFYV